MTPGMERWRRRGLRTAKALAAVLLVGLAPQAEAASRGATVREIRFWTAPGHTRVVLDLSAKAPYEVRRVANPDRIAINVRGARFVGQGPVAVGDGVIRAIRRNALAGRAQVVLDLGAAGEFRHFTLPAADGRPPRIVIDVFRLRAAAEAAAEAREVAPGAEPTVVQPGTSASPAPPAPAPPETGIAGAAGSGGPEELEGGAAPAPGRPFTVVIDAGHGGMDPGAMRRGLREKDITLAVALELARLVDATPGWRAVLTREGDYFVSLAERVRIARRARGDLFVSLHCNTHPRPTTAGMEVYFLSLQGATDREAQELADKENAADLVGLAPDEAQDDSVLSILMDLRMARVLDHSSRLAESVLTVARRSDFLGARRVKQARFQVLRSLAMPSALVEMAYLSNERDRVLLSSGGGQRRLAALLLEGVRDYRGEPARVAAAAAPAAGATWEHRYRVRRGDTLWELAQRHGTTIAEICERNGLRTPELRVGQRLRLPGTP